MSDSLGRHYSRLDRLLHRMAFLGIEIQKSLSDIEDRLHARTLAAMAIEKPVFITSLPRAGTTLLLDLVTRHPRFFTHTYRCMPFVLCPVLWASISRGFRRQTQLKERAHGDGMLTGYDSPEAFEEVLWKSFWPGKYQEERIALWRAEDRNREFEEFFANHLRKLMALNGGPAAKAMRYVSKNNANIARIPLLSAMFPDAIFLVPFRDPIDQTGSLLRQHRRFTDIHAKDAFTRDYMASIGHHEFGLALKRIDFPYIAGVSASDNPMTGEFWLSYWIGAYRHLLNLSEERLRFIDFDGLCRDPASGMLALGRALGETDAPAHLSAETARFHSAPRYDRAALGLEPSSVAAAKEVLSELAARAINGQTFH